MLILQESEDDDPGNEIDLALFRQVRELIERCQPDADAGDGFGPYVELDIWLSSDGGDAHAAQKIGLLLRSFADVIRVVIPDRAKSAATLMALGADYIYMASAAELGPLDTQLEKSGDSQPISALDAATALEHVITRAMTLVIGGGAFVLGETTLSREKVLIESLNFVAQITQGMLDDIDVTQAIRAHNLLLMTEMYAIELLESRNTSALDDYDKLVDDYLTAIADGQPQRSAQRVAPPFQHVTRFDFGSMIKDLIGGPIGGEDGIAHRLVQGYPDHIFVISPTRANLLGLPVLPLSGYSDARLARDCQQEAEQKSNNVVKIMSSSTDLD